jgi:HrpA-like RNA helicase
LRNSANLACPFVCLMSATFNEDVFLNYFIGNKPNKYDNYIFVEGRTAKRFENYLKEPTKNIFEEIAKTIRKIVDEGVDDLPSKGDVIIFLPSGKNPDLQLMLENMNKSLIAENRAHDIVSIIQISSNAQEYQTEEFLALDDIELKDQQVNVDKKVYKPRRRVILSTNVAETGLTLNELKYIIDAGFNAETEFNPILGLEYLATKPAPQSRIEQRIGRVGRKFDGVFYAMYTKRIKENLQENQYPDILTNDITALLLDLIIEQLRKKEIEKLDTVFQFADLDLLDMPAPDSLRYSLETLYALGAISYGAHKWATDDEAFYSNDELNLIESISITKVGRTLSKMLNPALSSLEACRMILSGFNCDVAIMDLITIAAYLSAEIKPRDLNAWFYIYQKGLPIVMNERVFIKTRLLVGDQFIEGLILFNSFVGNIKHSGVELNKWYEETGLDKVDMIKKFLTTRNTIIDHLLGLRINIFHNKEFALIRQDKIVDTFECIQRIKKCIYDGYRQNMITLSGESYSKSNTPVNEPKLFTSMRQKMVEHGIALERPRFVLYHSLSLARKKGKEIAVKIETDLVSIMDHYVGVDEQFLL